MTYFLRSVLQAPKRAQNSEFMLTRREVLASGIVTASTPALALNPQSGPFIFTSDSEHFGVSSKFGNWRLEKSAFGSKSKLIVTAGSDRINVELRSGSILGTNFCFDLTFTFENILSPHAVILCRSVAYGIDDRVTLAEFLSRNERLVGTDKAIQCRLNFGANVALRATVDSFDANWSFLLKECLISRLGVSEKLGVTMLSLAKQPSDLGQKYCANIQTDLDFGDNFLRVASRAFQVMPDLAVPEPCTIAFYLFESASSYFSLEPQSVESIVNISTFLDSGYSLDLPLTNYRFVGDFDHEASSLLVGGLVAETGARLTKNGVALGLSSKQKNLVCSVELSEAAQPIIDHAFSVRTGSLATQGSINLEGQCSLNHTVHINTGIDPNPYLPGEQYASTEQASADSIITETYSVLRCRSCIQPEKPTGLTYFVTRLIHDKDLTDLTFEFYNFFHVEGDASDGLQPLDVPGPNLIFVNFPPQYYEEDAFWEAMGCDGETPGPSSFPTNITPASPARLVFEYPRELGTLNLTKDELLAWHRWKPKSSSASRHPNLIEPPRWDETSIEVPANIFMQTGPDTFWQADGYESGTEGRHVLFHSALRSRARFDRSESDFLRRPRVIPMWTSAFSECGVDSAQTKPKNFLDFVCRRIGLQPLGSPAPSISTAVLPDDAPRDVFSQEDYQQIVRLSHDLTLCPDPPKAHHLLLTDLGAWADFEAYWPKNKARSCYSNLQKWRHRATQGRVQFDRKVRRGFLYPFGHRILLIEETNRLLHRHGEADYAVPKKKFYIVVEQETVVNKEARTLEGQSDESYKMIFRSVRIVETSTPNLDEVLKTPIDYDPGTDPKNATFTGSVCGEPYYFNLIGTDWRGREISFSVPLVFVDDLNVEAGKIDGYVNAINKSHYFNEMVSGKVLPESFSDLAGQLVAIAQSYQQGDTDFELVKVRFKGVGQRLPVEFDCGNLPDYLDPDSGRCDEIIGAGTENTSPFYPIVEVLEGAAPTLSKGTPDGGGTSWFELVDPKITQDGFEVIAVQHSSIPDDTSSYLPDIIQGRYPAQRLQLPFHQNGDSSGGVSGPTPKINAWSRTKGPLGIKRDILRERSPTEASLSVTSANSLVQSSSFFDLNAKILGVIPLSTIIQEMGLGSTTPAMLDFFNIGGDTRDSTGFVYDWDTPYGGFDLSILKFGPLGTKDQSKLVISGGVFIELSEKPQPTGFISGSLKNFFVTLEVAGNGIRAEFSQIGLYAPLGQKIEFSVDINEVKFIGPVMEFIQKLKESLGFGEGFDVVLNSDSVSAIMGPFELPGISFGVFSLSGISFYAAADIFFKGNRPVLFTFAFSSRSRPFTLAVAFLGGRGHFLFAVDTSGVQRIEASLEFGAVAEFNFGGFAHGNLYVMGGVFYSSKREAVVRKIPDSSGTIVDVPASETVISVQIYVRAGGSLRCFGFITVSLDVHLGLALTKRGNQSVASGTATMRFSVKIGFFKKSFSVTFSKEFAGSSSDAGQERIAARTSAAVQQRLRSPASPSTPRSSHVASFVNRSTLDLGPEDQTVGLEQAVVFGQNPDRRAFSREEKLGISRENFRYYWYAFEENRRHRL